MTKYCRGSFNSLKCHWGNLCKPEPLTLNMDPLQALLALLVLGRRLVLREGWSLNFIAFTKQWLSLRLCGGLAAVDTCENNGCLHKHNCSNINSGGYVHKLQRDS